MSPSFSRPFGIVALAIAVGCSYRPTTFADRDPVRDVDDDLPIPLPIGQDLLKPLYYSDVYVRLTLSEALDPAAPVSALDVNSMDEVVVSSWFASFQSPADTESYRRDGPPRTPVRLVDTVAPSETDDVRAAVDARGLSYELLGDLPQAPEMRTASAVIASRLMFAIGYRVPEVWIDRGPRGERVAAMRWPAGSTPGGQVPGIDLGATLISTLRFDDPFDIIDHKDRRSLRGLSVAMAWLGMDKVRPGMLRDVYVGPSGLGHVQHHVVWLDESLGVGQFMDATEDRDPTRVGGNVLRNLFTLGFAPRPAQDPESAIPSVGFFDGNLDPPEFRIRPPFAPFYEMQTADHYWMAKRVAAVPRSTIAAAVRAARLSRPEAARFLEAALVKRQRAIRAWGTALTTPLEVLDADRFVRPRRPDGSIAVTLTNISPAAEAGTRDIAYQVEWLDQEGDTIADPTFVRGRRDVQVVVPRSLLDANPYLIVKMRMLVADDDLAPSRFEMHLRPGDDGVRIAGIRH